MTSKILLKTSLITLALSAPAVAGTTKVIGFKTASGARPGVAVVASAKSPEALYVRVSSEPRRKVALVWSVACSRGSATRTRPGRWTGRTPERRRLELPYRDPSRCTVTASARLEGRGRVKLFVLRR